MYEGVGVARHVALNHQADAGHIEPARRNVSGDKRRASTVAKVGERAIARRLILIAVNDPHSAPHAAQRATQPIRRVLRVDEDERARRGGLCFHPSRVRRKGMRAPPWPQPPAACSRRRPPRRASAQCGCASRRRGPAQRKSSRRVGTPTRAAGLQKGKSPSRGPYAEPTGRRATGRRPRT